MRFFSKLVSAVAFSCVLPAAQAETYFVSPSGSDSFIGSELLPWKTLRKGFTSLSAGDHLIVRGGEYREILGGATPMKIRTGNRDNRIMVSAYPGEFPVLRGLLWLSSPSYWTIDGLNVTWQDGQPSTYHMVKFTNGISWEFKRAEVWGAKSYANILVAGTTPKQPSNWRILDCSIHDTYKSNNTNQDQLIYVNTGLSAGKGFIYRNLLFNAYNGNGIKIGGADNTQGTANVTVKYNTIYNCVQGILVAWQSANNQIYRNIIQKTSGNYGLIRGYQLVGTGNIAYDNIGYEAKSMFLNDAGYEPVQDLGGNYIPIDPQFVDPVGYNFRVLNRDARYYGRYAVPAPAP